MTANDLHEIRKINFLLEGAALARANALTDEIPGDLRRMWLEDAEHMTDCAERLIAQVHANGLLSRVPAWEMEP